jgi:hypothetical protein
VVLFTGRPIHQYFEKLKPVRMKTRTLSPMGSMHPILFFVFVYVVALLFSIFICSSLFYSCNAKSSNVLSEKSETSPVEKNPATTIALQR